MTNKKQAESTETIPPKNKEPVSVESMEAEVPQGKNPAAVQGDAIPVDNLKPNDNNAV